MKKILRLVTTSVLTLTLVACGEASSSVSSSVSSTPASSVSSVSSAYANVTTVTLSAATATLTQVLGAQRRVTVTAALNANTNPNLAIEWFVNGVKSNQSGRVLEYVPTEVGAFVISAKVGNISSNNLTVNVSLPTLAVEEVEWASASQILVTAPGGAEVTVSGNELLDSSYYDLKNGQYVVNLKTGFTQGQTATLSLAREGEAAFTQVVTYDTREFKIDSIKVDQDFDIGTDSLVAVGGVYTIVRPFDEGAGFDKTLTITLSQKELLTATSQVAYLKQYTVPTGATAINSLSVLANSSTSLVETFVVNSDTVLGNYVMTYTMGGKVVTFTINVVEAKPEIVLVKDSFQFDADGSGTYATTEVVKAGADGVFEITKPFTTFGTNLKAFKLDLLARNFEESELGLANQLNVSVSGPSTFLSTSSQLFSGINTLNTGLHNTTGTNALNTFAFKAFTTFTNSYLRGLDETSALITFSQSIDSGTPVGLYEITMSAGQPGSELTKTVQVRVVAPTPTINFAVDSYATAESNVRTVDPVKGTAANTFTIEKPSTTGITYGLGVYSVLQNYQSVEVTDANEIAADQLRETADKLLFSANSKFFRKVDISVAQAGPAVLFPTIEAAKYQLTLTSDDFTNGRDGVILVNRSAKDAAAINSAETKILIDEAFDFDGNGTAFNAGALLPKLTGDRDVIEVTSATVTGTYTMTVRVDNLVQVLTVNVVSPQPKIFVQEQAAFNTSKESLTFRSTTDAFGGTFDASGNRASVLSKDGVFEVELGLAVEKVWWKSYVGLSVSDLVPGTYQYQVTKKYPDGVVLDNVYSATVAAANINANGLLTDVTLQDWNLNEIAAGGITKLGDYVYTFRFGTTTKTYTVRVLPSPQLEVSALKTDTTAATLHNTSFRLVPPTSGAMAAKAISIDFAKLNLVGATHYTVQVTLAGTPTLVLGGSLGTAGVNITGKTANTTAADLLVKTTTPAVAFAFGATNTINLGTLSSASTPPTEGEVVIYTIRFYKAGTANLEQIGEVAGQQIKVKVTA
jgi:hypothetical protein